MVTEGGSSWPATHGWFLTRDSSRTRPMPTCTRGPRRKKFVEDFAGARRLDYWVTGYGTGGTLEGSIASTCQGDAADEDRRLRA